jgi:hypothetical protein
MKTGIRAALSPGYRQGLESDMGRQDFTCGPFGQPHQKSRYKLSKRACAQPLSINADLYFK